MRSWFLLIYIDTYTLDIFRNQPIGQSVTKKQHTIYRNIFSLIFRIKNSVFSIFIRPIAIKMFSNCKLYIFHSKELERGFLKNDIVILFQFQF